MKARIEMFTQAGGEYNEDLIYKSEDYVLLLDGSSGLFKNQIMGCNSDAVWYVNQVAEYLQTHLRVENDIFSVIDNMLVHIDQLYKCSTDNNVPKINRPSAAMVLIRERDDNYEIFSLGDCTTIIKTKTDIQILFDDTVSKLDNHVIQKMTEISRQKNITVKEARSEVSDLLKSNRALKNTKDGYSILGFDRNAIKDAKYMKLRPDDIESICMYSDGVADYYDVFNLCQDAQSFMFQVENKSLEDLVHEIRKIQSNDSNFNIFPRLKDDDASIIYLDCKDYCND